MKDDKVDISEEAKSLMKALLEPDVSKRLTIEDVKKHIWLEEAYKPDALSYIEIFTE